ncbi:MAG TPA: alpha/beta hydrolase [Candidatus Binataceae bacterium]|nr:alpha/beta hydrolase [Candidatus Binataceae bacterium]
MNREDLSFTSSSDGLRVAYYRWAAGPDAKAVVQIAHGLGEHALRYAHVAAALNRAGFHVYANDHRGHGRSAPSPESYGDFGAPGWGGVVSDAADLTRIIQAREPGLPVILLGHSMGSFLAQDYLLAHSALIRGCVLSGSAAPDLIAHLIEQVGEGGLESLNVPFEPARTPFDWLSRDPAEVDAYVADPACGFNLNERSRESAKSAWERTAETTALARVRRDIPIYILAGDADPVNQHLEYLKPVAERYRAAGINDVSEKYYAEGRHEMFNEINRDEVLRDLLMWLQRIIPA